MTPILAALLCGSVFALAAAFVVLPMAREIPARLERQWARELENHARAETDASEPAPRVDSFLFKVIMVALALLLGVVVALTYGWTTAGAAYSLYYFGLLLLVTINVKHALLPDSVVLTTLWIGLLYHACIDGSAATHLYGAALGYLVPFLIGLVFKASTGRVVIGGGDLKTLAMAGAWFGLGALPAILVTFVLGCVLWAVVMHFVDRNSRGFLSTGPAHLLASMAVTLGAGTF